MGPVVASADGNSLDACRVGGPAPKSRKLGCPTQPKHHTAIFVARQSFRSGVFPKLPPERGAKALKGLGGGRCSALGEHAGENALHLLLVLGGVVPVNGALQSVAEKHLGFPAQQLLRPRIIRDAV